MDRSQVSVVIVGAGVSGLAAALTLIQGGIKDVTILEALPRTGGRVRTIHHGMLGFSTDAAWLCDAFPTMGVVLATATDFSRAFLGVAARCKLMLE